MGYKYIDDDDKEGWAFVDSTGAEYHCSTPRAGISGPFVSVGEGDEISFDVFVSDLPKLIKILQAAYDYKG